MNTPAGTAVATAMAHAVPDVGEGAVQIIAVDDTAVVQDHVTAMDAVPLVVPGDNAVVVIVHGEVAPAMDGVQHDLDVVPTNLDAGLQGIPVGEPDGVATLPLDAAVWPVPVDAAPPAVGEAAVLPADTPATTAAPLAIAAPVNAIATIATPAVAATPALVAATAPFDAPAIVPGTAPIPAVAALVAPVAAHATIPGPAIFPGPVVVDAPALIAAPALAAAPPVDAAPAVGAPAVVGAPPAVVVPPVVVGPPAVVGGPAVVGPLAALGPGVAVGPLAHNVAAPALLDVRNAEDIPDTIRM